MNVKAVFIGYKEKQSRRNLFRSAVYSLSFL